MSNVCVSDKYFLMMNKGFSGKRLTGYVNSSLSLGQEDNRI